MSTRKYLAEFGVHMVANARVLVQQDSFDQAEELVEAHIYLICRCPRILIDPDSITVTKHRITGRFRRQIHDAFEDIEPTPVSRTVRV